MFYTVLGFRYHILFSILHVFAAFVFCWAKDNFPLWWTVKLYSIIFYHMPGCWTSTCSITSEPKLNLSVCRMCLRLTAWFWHSAEVKSSQINSQNTQLLHFTFFLSCLLLLFCCHGRALTFHFHHFKKNNTNKSHSHTEYSTIQKKITAHWNVKKVNSPCAK